MKKRIFLLLLGIFLLNSIAAINLTIEKTPVTEAMIYEIKNPWVFDLRITNNEFADTFEIYNVLGYKQEPNGTFEIGFRENKKIQLIIYPREDLQTKGNFAFSYYIQASNREVQEEKLVTRIVELKDVFEVGSEEINPTSNSLSIYIQNKENIKLEDVNVRFSSLFFNLEEKISLEAYEKKKFTIELNKEDFKKLIAGYYTLKAEVTYKTEKALIEGQIVFAEKDILTTNENEFGWIVNTKTIKKENQGNVVVKTETIVKKNIISRLFTGFSPMPDSVERKGLRVTYKWAREVSPGEVLEIKVKTNWLFPLIIILLIVAIVVFVKRYTTTSISLKKKVTFIHAKGGEFALKVTINARARKYVERVNIIDRLPALVRIYERFGGEVPARVDEKNKRIEWNFEKLEEGEVRIMSYVIYSKIGVLGKFALPTATVIFNHEGKLEEAESNRAFFVAEPKRKAEF